MLHHLLTPTNITIALIAINLIAFAAFGLDKAKAQRGQYRISEATLLWFAFLGGTLGAYAGRSLFRHKTRKQPFSSHLFQVAVLQMVVLGVLAGWWMLTAHGHGTNPPPRPGSTHAVRPHKHR